MKRLLSVMLLIGAATCSAPAFSPYENHLLTAKVKRVGLIASVKAGKESETETSLKTLSERKVIKKLKKADITNLSCFKKVLNNKTWIMIYFDYSGKDYLAAATSFESADTAISKLTEYIDPHPAAARRKTTWLQMEWITYIRGSLSERKATNTFSMVTTIKPEKEQEYRALHQSVWPGVVDQMARGNNRHFSIFLVEIENTIYEFFYVEYAGTDPEKDSKMDGSDPVNLRWWKQTDPCQSPLPGTKSIWSMMDKISTSN